MVDNYYTSFSIVEILLSKGIYVTGTLRRRRGGPSLLNARKIKDAPKKIILPFSKNSINAFLYLDLKLVGFISSYFQTFKDNILEERSVNHNNVEFIGFITTEKPKIVSFYNCNMNAVDILDQEIKYYSLQRKSSRWTFKFSIYLIHICLFNAFILYKELLELQKKSTTLIDFQLFAVKWFCEWSKTQTNNSIDLEVPESTNIFNEENKYNSLNSHSPIFRAKRTTCTICYKKEGKIHHTQFYCLICQNGYCINSKRLCWFEHHNSTSNGSIDSDV